MLYSQIKSLLQSDFADAEEIWIAVAMMNYQGYNLLKHLNQDVRINIIVGIDLPTPPGILKKLQERASSTFSAKVCKTDYIFHPKLYIVKKKNGAHITYIGSSNATMGGLEKNEELNIRIQAYDSFNNTLAWFHKLNEKSILISDDFIEEYKRVYKRIKKKEKAIKSDVISIKTVLNNKLQGQFFTEQDHEVLSPKYWHIENSELKKLRKNVWNKLKELHYRIYSNFEEFDLHDLHRHYRLAEIISKYYFNPFSGYFINALWLHYGKSKPHLMSYEKDKSFLDHTRIQFIIHHDNVGVWLIHGFQNRGRIDREHFRNNMKQRNFRRRFYENAIKLAKDDYWIETRGLESKKYFNEINSLDELYRITELEESGYYFIIGKFFDPTDNRVSNSRIELTVLKEFQKLYPLYIMMRKGA
jgi:HKD family nuclease